jgi:hypothetical protein
MVRVAYNVFRDIVTLLGEFFLNLLSCKRGGGGLIYIEALTVNK